MSDGRPGSGTQTSEMRIETERLLLRPLTESDSEVMTRLFAHPEVVRYSGGYSPSLEEVRDRIRAHIDSYYTNRGYGLLAAELIATGEVVGRVGLLDTELDPTADAELHYHLMPGAWGSGLATEASEAVLAWARRELGLTRIVAAIHPENSASQRVAEKCGLSFWKEMVIPDGGVCRIYQTDLVSES